MIVYVACSSNGHSRWVWLFIVQAILSSISNCALLADISSLSLCHLEEGGLLFKLRYRDDEMWSETETIVA